MRKNAIRHVTAAAIAACGVAASGLANAALLTDPNDPRSWQGATVGTFAALFYGSDTPANRQLVIDNQLLDDGVIPLAGATQAVMISTTGVGSSGTSHDLTGTGSYFYTQPSSLGITGAGNAVDNHWIQTDNVIGHAVWDLGAQATKAAIFNTIDHGPLPGEAIESTVYLSNDLVTWTQAVTERVWLEGFMANTGILWDGFAYAVGTGTSQTFRYASIIHGGPGALISDGDNEINGILGLDANFEVIQTPEAASVAFLALGLAGLGWLRRRRGI